MAKYYYEQSDNISVFPSVQRTCEESNKFTEERLTNYIYQLIPKNTNNDGFVITNSDSAIAKGEFEFNIHGYYFKISEIKNLLDSIKSTANYIWGKIVTAKDSNEYTNLVNYDGDTTLDNENDKFVGVTIITSTDNEKPEGICVKLLTKIDNNWYIPYESKLITAPGYPHDKFNLALSINESGNLYWKAIKRTLKLHLENTEHITFKIWDSEEEEEKASYYYKEGDKVQIGTTLAWKATVEDGFKFKNYSEKTVTGTQPITAENATITFPETTSELCTVEVLIKGSQSGYGYLNNEKTEYVAVYNVPYESTITIVGSKLTVTKLDTTESTDIIAYATEPTKYTVSYNPGDKEVTQDDPDDNEFEITYKFKYWLDTDNKKIEDLKIKVDQADVIIYAEFSAECTNSFELPSNQAYTYTDWIIDKWVWKEEGYTEKEYDPSGEFTPPIETYIGDMELSAKWKFNVKVTINNTLCTVKVFDSADNEINPETYNIEYLSTIKWQAIAMENCVFETEEGNLKQYPKVGCAIIDNINSSERATIKIEATALPKLTLNMEESESKVDFPVDILYKSEDDTEWSKYTGTIIAQKQTDYYIKVLKNIDTVKEDDGYIIDYILIGSTKIYPGLSNECIISVDDEDITGTIYIKYKLTVGFDSSSIKNIGGISFEVNGATKTEGYAHVSQNDKITIKTELTTEESKKYKFTQWYITKYDGKETSTDDNPISTNPGNYTIYKSLIESKETQEYFDVTLECDETVSGELPATPKVKSGESITVKNISAISKFDTFMAEITGGTFVDGSTIKKNIIDGDDITIYNITTNITIYLYGQCTVTYDCKEPCSWNKNEIVVPYGETATNVLTTEDSSYLDVISIIPEEEIELSKDSKNNKLTVKIQNMTKENLTVEAKYNTLQEISYIDDKSTDVPESKSFNPGDTITIEKCTADMKGKNLSYNITNNTINIFNFWMGDDNNRYYPNVQIPLIKSVLLKSNYIQKTVNFEFTVNKETTEITAEPTKMSISSIASQLYYTTATKILISNITFDKYQLKFNINPYGYEYGTQSYYLINITYVDSTIETFLYKFNCIKEFTSLNLKVNNYFQLSTLEILSSDYDSYKIYPESDDNKIIYNQLFIVNSGTSTVYLYKDSQLVIKLTVLVNTVVGKINEIFYYNTNKNIKKLTGVDSTKLLININSNSLQICGKEKCNTSFVILYKDLSSETIYVLITE